MRNIEIDTLTAKSMESVKKNKSVFVKSRFLFLILCLSLSFEEKKKSFSGLNHPDGISMKKTTVNSCLKGLILYLLILYSSFFRGVILAKPELGEKLNYFLDNKFMI